MLTYFHDASLAMQHQQSRECQQRPARSLECLGLERHLGKQLEPLHHQVGDEQGKPRNIASGATLKKL